MLLIAPQPFFLNRGTPINVRAMVETLAEQGYRVDLLAYPFGENLKIPGVQILRSAKVPGINSVPIGPSWQKIVLDILMAPQVIWLGFRNSYAVVHGVEEGAWLAGTLGMLRRVPFIFDMDSCVPEQLAKSKFPAPRILIKLIEKLEAFFLQRAEAVLTVCTALSDKVRELAPNARIAQIEDFPYEEAMSVDQDLLAKVREEFDLQGRRVAVYTGNFESYQGIDLLLEAFALACKELELHSMPVLLLVGGGAFGSAALLHYQRRAEELGISPYVVFTGSRPASEMGAFMELADVLVSPRSVGGNTPLKLYSYMAAKKPIVATRIESHTQVLDDSSAILADPSPSLFSQALVRAFEDSAVAQTYRENVRDAAWELIETKYNRQEFERRLCELYQSVLQSDEYSKNTPLPEELRER